MEFEKILDKIIETTEKNLTMQSEFLKSIYELKITLENFHRDNIDIKKDLDLVLNNSFEIISKMKMASNEKIIDMIETLFHKIQEENALTQKICENISQIKTTKEQLDTNSHIITGLAKDVKIVASSHKWITRILTLIAMIVIGFQIMFSVYKVNQDEKLRTEILQKVETLKQQNHQNFINK